MRDCFHIRRDYSVTVPGCSLQSNIEQNKGFSMREGSRGIRVLTLSRGILNIQSLSTYAAHTGEYRCFRSHVSRTPGGAGSPPSPVHTQTKSRKLIHAAPVTDDRYPCVPCVSRLLRRLFTGTRLSTAVARAVASLEPATVWAATDGRGLQVGLELWKFGWL